MAVTAVSLAIQAVFGTPAERLTLIVLCEAVNESRIQACGPWDVWLSQSTIAQRVGVSSRQVRRVLTQLQERGLIIDTGQRVHRGVVKWEVVQEELEALSPRTPMSTLDASVLGDEEKDPKTDDPGHPRPPGRTSTTTTPDTDVRSPRTPTSYKPEGNRKSFKPEVEPGRSPSAHDVSSTDLPPNSENNGDDPSLVTAPATQPDTADQEQQLAELREQLPGTSGALRDQTVRCIERLEAELDDPELVTA